MKIQIITPDITIFSGEVKLAQFPGLDGSFEVLDRHAPLIAALASGKIKVRGRDDKDRFYNIRSGVVEVKNNEVLVLAE
ncbi:MAG: ATP synthase F1 subunit epsilon [Bacteroidales bacterium]